MDVMDLINHLRLEGPCDEYHVPRASDENAPPLGDESTNEGEAADKGEDSERELMEANDPEMKPTEEEDPEEGFTRVREELIGEENPEEDPEQDPAEDGSELINEVYFEEDPEDSRAESGVPETKGGEHKDRVTAWK